MEEDLDVLNSFLQGRFIHNPERDFYVEILKINWEKQFLFGLSFLKSNNQLDILFKESLERVMTRYEPYDLNAQSSPKYTGIDKEFCFKALENGLNPKVP